MKYEYDHICKYPENMYVWFYLFIQINPAHNDLITYLHIFVPMLPWGILVRKFLSVPLLVCPIITRKWHLEYYIKPRWKLIKNYSISINLIHHIITDRFIGLKIIHVKLYIQSKLPYSIFLVAEWYAWITDIWCYIKQVCFESLVFRTTQMIQMPWK